MGSEKMNAADVLAIMKENSIRIDDILKADGYFVWTLWIDEDVEEHFRSCCEEMGINPDDIDIDIKNKIFEEVKSHSWKTIEDESCSVGCDVLRSAMRRAITRQS